jgi:putative addiction module killer protein
MVYTSFVLEVIQSVSFRKWLSKLADRQAAARIQVRVRRMSLGTLGDVKPVGGGVSEARIDYGPGYRLYFVRRGPLVIVLLCGGTKSTQRKDIARAIEIANDWRD